jgi:hypothetical protein
VNEIMDILRNRLERALLLRPQAVDAEAIGREPARLRERERRPTLERGSSAGRR